MMRPSAAWLLPVLLVLNACSSGTDERVAGPHAPDDFLYAELDIATLQQRMADGSLDSHALTRAYLDRIAAIDKAGPSLHAVIETNPDALREAAARDAERRAGKLRGPLHGIPVLIKDNIDATPMVNSAGSLALRDFRPARDAFLVHRLREAGAVILGKTNLSEWANFRSTRGISGWSARGGQTRNPYALDHSPCGSSSGSAVAVSANLAVVAVGTETDGSLLCPAAVNGIVGLKPTVGLVSRNGILPISFSQDTAGPMARSVADAALLLSALAGRDESDPATATMPGRAVYDHAARLSPDALRGARIGVLHNDLSEAEDIGGVYRHALDALRDAGATLVDAALPTDGQWDDAETTVLLHEFKAGLERYLRDQHAPVHTLSELIAFNRRHADREMAHFDQDLFERSEATTGLADPAYIRARTKARQLAGPLGLDMVLDAMHLDAVVAPTTGAAWRIDPARGDDFRGAGYGAAAVAGYPSLTVPMGARDGLPLGLTFMGRAWSEPRLLELGYAYEQRTLARTPPAFLKTLPHAH